MTAADLLANAAVSVAMNTVGRLHYERLMAAARRPRAAQAAALRRILAANVETAQGRELGLASIHDPDAFRRAVPIRDYEALRPLVMRQIETGETVIAPQAPILYARTSGTTGAAKYIPVTAAALAQMRRAQRAMAYVQHRALGAFSGKVLGIGGPLREETLASGVAAGATTGLIYETMPWAMRAKYVAPAAVFGIADYDERYRTLARLAALEPRISTIATANPSTILRLLEVLRANLPAIAELASGPRRAALARLAARDQPPTLAELWPDLRSVVTWLGGGCAVAAAKVRRQLPDGARMVDAGYVASEVRGSITVDVDNNLALPMLEDVFFEFVEVGRWDAGERGTLLLDELADGGQYYVFVSTIAGLLRYHMNDVVRVSGRIGATPCLQFVRKGRGVTSITGEKLSEDQLEAAMAKVSPPPHFFIGLADAEAARYRIYAAFDDHPTGASAVIDSGLRRLNVEYDAKRASGRLGEPEVIWVSPRAAEAYHRHCVETKKQREAQVKVLSLQPAEEFDFDFSPFIVPDDAPAAPR